MGAKSNQGAPATGASSGVSMVNTGPWAPQAPYLTDAFSKAKDQYGANAAKTYFPTSTVQPFNANQSIAMTDVLNVGTDPNVPGASRLNLDTLRGKYLDPASNPWLKSTFDMGANDVTRAFQTATAPTTSASFSGGGRYGSGSYNLAREGNERALGSTLDNLATQIYGGNYQQERARQMSAIGNAPMLAQAHYINPMARLAVGDRMQQQGQAETADHVNRYNFNRDAASNALNSYIAQITGNYGQSGMTQQQMGNSAQTPFYTNPGATAAGGAMGLASLFNQAGGFSGKGNGATVPGSTVPGNGSVYV